jgi:hypothetical protein
MIGWALYIRADAEPPIKGLDVFAMRRLTDTTMIIAGDIAQQSLEHQIIVGEWLRTATDLASRNRAIKYLERAYALGRTSGRPELYTRAAMAVGRVRWLGYELAPWRAPPCERLSPSIDSASIVGTREDGGRLSPEYAVKRLHNELTDCFGATAVFDNVDYMEAEAKFREAYAQSPSDVRVFRHVAMVLLERKRWLELESLARTRVRTVRDAWAFLALGLAQQRSGNSAAAIVSFDSGAVLLGAHEAANAHGLGNVRLGGIRCVDRQRARVLVVHHPAVVEARSRSTCRISGACGIRRAQVDGRGARCAWCGFRSWARAHSVRPA